MASWTAWIQTAVCRQPVTPPPCAWAPQTPWTSSRRHSCPPLTANYRLSTNECVSWWAGTAPTSSPASTPLMESESFVHPFLLHRFTAAPYSTDRRETNPKNILQHLIFMPVSPIHLWPFPKDTAHDTQTAESRVVS